MNLIYDTDSNSWWDEGDNRLQVSLFFDPEHCHLYAHVGGRAVLPGPRSGTGPKWEPLDRIYRLARADLDLVPGEAGFVGSELDDRDHYGQALDTAARLVAVRLTPVTGRPPVADGDAWWHRLRSMADPTARAAALHSLTALQLDMIHDEGTGWCQTQSRDGAAANDLAVLGEVETEIDRRKRLFRSPADGSGEGEQPGDRRLNDTVAGLATAG